MPRKPNIAEQGKLLLQMADLTKERVRAYFDEPDIGRLASRPENRHQMGCQARPGVARTHRARPVTVITYGTRNVGVVLVGIDGGDSGLLPDTNVNVTVTTSSEPDALSIPREALYSTNGKPYVFKVVGRQTGADAGRHQHHQPHQRGHRQRTNEGDWVATGTTSGQPLQEGVPIKVVR